MNSGEVPTLPRGRHHLSRDEVHRAQRERLLNGIVEVVAEQGYAATTVGAVLKRVHISRETFYQHFSGKEDCFLAAFDVASGLLITLVEQSLGSADDPPLTRLDRVLATYLDTLVKNPTLARTFLIEVYGAGRAAVSRRIAVQERFAVDIADVLVRDEHWSGDVDPNFAGRAVIGAISAAVTALIDAGQYDRLPELREQIHALVKALIAGSTS